MELGKMWIRVALVALVAVASIGVPSVGRAQSARADLLDTNLIVRFLNAGDGEAVWITTPSPTREMRKTVLINCGPPGYGGRLALQLQTAGVNQIDSLLLSGADDELIGGCGDILQQIPIAEIRWTGQRGNTPTWSAFESLLQGQGWHPVALASSDELYWGGVTATVLNPGPVADPTPNPDNSLVLEIDYGRWGILYAGEIHAQGENQVKPWFDAGRFSVQVLKVADRGSPLGSSPEFLQAVFPPGRNTGVPRTAIITNGGANRAAQVDQTALDGLRDKLLPLAVELVSTADHGTITEVVDPNWGPHYVAEH